MKRMLVATLPLLASLLGAPPAVGSSAEPVIAPPVPTPSGWHVGVRLATDMPALDPTTRVVLGGEDTSYEDPLVETWELEVARISMYSRRGRLRWEPLGAPTGDTRDLRLAPGQVTCVRARGHGNGQVSEWAQDCALRALDDRRLRHHGRLRRVDDERYADGRATVLWETGRLVARRVPAGSVYGPVFTDPRFSKPGSCALPRWAIRGHRMPPDSIGYSLGRSAHWMYRYTAHSGVALMRGDVTGTCPVGGLVVVAPWAQPLLQVGSTPCRRCGWGPSWDR